MRVLLAFLKLFIEHPLLTGIISSLMLSCMIGIGFAVVYIVLDLLR